MRIVRTALAVLALSMACPCIAAEIVVARNDEASFRQALQTANVTPGPSRITFASSTGTIRLTSPVTLSAANLVIEGPATIDVHDLPVGIDIHASGVTLRHLRVIGITSGGGGLRIVANASAPALHDIVIENNELRSDKVDGNPVAVTVGSAPGVPAGVTVSRVRIEGNLFDGFGGDGDAVLLAGYSADYRIEDVTIERNVFQHCTFPVELAAAPGSNGGHIARTVVRGNRFLGNMQAVSIGALADSSVGCVMEQTLIEDNTFLDNEHGITMITALGSSQARVAATTIRRNLFAGAQLFALTMGMNGGSSTPTHDNVVDGLVFDGNRVENALAFGVLVGSGGDGTQDNTVTDVQLTNNIITGCKTGVLVNRLQGSGNRLDNVRLVNNTISGNSGAGIGFSQLARPGVEVVNNIVWNNSPDFGGSPAVSRSNLLSDPRFVDPLHGNWSVHAGSAAIDAGASDVAPATDHYGQPRCGAAPDVGAIEYCLSRRRRAAR